MHTLCQPRSPAARLAFDAETLLRGVMSSGRPFAVNMVENTDSFVLTAALPGVTRDRIDVAAREQAIHVTVAPAPAVNAEETSVQPGLQEFGSFEGVRSFRYHPDHIDAKRLSAKLADGILTVTLPKKSPETHRVEID